MVMHNELEEVRHATPSFAASGLSWKGPKRKYLRICSWLYECPKFDGDAERESQACHCTSFAAPELKDKTDKEVIEGMSLTLLVS